MKHLLILAMGLLFCIFDLQIGFAQCPATLTISAGSVTNATCPDNGSVTLAGSGVGNPAVTYTIVSGPSHVGMQQSSHVFNSLSAGTYVFRASCNSQTAQVSVIITTSYTQLNSNFNATVSSLCTNYNAGGTITVSGVTGGRPPYQYSIIANNSASYNDVLSNYSSSNTYTASSWGTYQVRVKDACGAFVTKTVTLAPTYPAAKFGGAIVSFQNIACDSAGIWFWLYDDNGQPVSLTDYPRLKFNVYEKASTGNNCNNKGALIKSFELLPNNRNYFVIPRRDVIVETITPCGEVRTNCYYYPEDDKLKTYWEPMLMGCGTMASPQTLTIKHLSNRFSKPPLTIRLYNHTTNTLMQTITSNSNWECCSFTGLAVTNHYKIVVSDACNKEDSLIIVPPTGSIGFAPVDGGTVVEKDCSYQNGKTTVKLKLTGAVANLNITTITITSGPDNVGKSAVLNVGTNKFEFYEMTPGATYGFVINNGCGTTNLHFTVPNDNWRNVEFRITPSVIQQCGGSGTINANIVYTGFGSVRSELWLNDTKVDQNNSGVYINKAPGLYTVKAIAEQEWCTNATMHVKSDTIRVLPDGAFPVVSRRIAYVCNNPAATGGKAFIQVTGFGPFTYDIRRISPNPQASYTNLATAAAASYTINNLDAYAVYSLRVTDNCGKSTTTELVVGTIGALSFENPYQPCVGTNYVLQAPSIPGATYSWIKEGTPLVLSSTRDLFFANYVAAYDGKYICNIIFPGGCLTRELIADLSSTHCGGILPVEFESVTAVAKDCKAIVQWKVTDADVKRFEVEKSTDGRNFIKIADISVSAVNGGLFSYTDPALFNGINYYRIKAVEGVKFSYSGTVSVTNNCKKAGFDATVYPNPVATQHTTLVINSDAVTVYELRIINALGAVVKRSTMNAVRGGNRLLLDVTDLAPGMYFIKVDNGVEEKVMKLYRQ